MQNGSKNVSNHKILSDDCKKHEYDAHEPKDTPEKECYFTDFDPIVFDDCNGVKIQCSVWVNDQYHIDEQHITSVKVDDVNVPHEWIIDTTINILDRMLTKCIKYVL